MLSVLELTETWFALTVSLLRSILTPEIFSVTPDPALTLSSQLDTS